jgi:hypothetical protein
LECWNNGIEGSGTMQYWVNGKIFVDDKNKMAKVLLKPTFQYSNIPLFHRNGINQELLKDLYSQPIVEFPRR